MSNLIEDRKKDMQQRINIKLDNTNHTESYSKLHVNSPPQLKTEIERLNKNA